LLLESLSMIGEAPSTTAPVTPATQSKNARLRRILALAGFATAAGATALLTLWAVAALYFDVRVSWLRVPVALGYLIAVLAAWIKAQGRWQKWGWTAAGFVLVLSWWLT